MADEEMADLGTSAEEVPGYEDPELGWLPSSGRNQSCALCADSAVAWLHPLATDQVGFSEYGKEYTLPTFWTLCERCELLYAEGADSDLTRVIQESPGKTYLWGDADADDVSRRTLAVFRQADLGARRFSAGDASVNE